MEHFLSMAALPAGTVTFLFTDVEGSTRLWREHPDGMPETLARHDEIVREAIVGSGGFVVKTTGDGFHAVFGEPAAAVDAAVAAQLALGATSWPLPEPLRVRMGLHSGPAESRDGDYYGTSVNRAARLMSAAHGGQVVVSHATEQLLAETRIELLDLGEHTLRDLGRRERIFQVVHPGLEREFPPLASLGSFLGNLPAQTDSFVGREDDLARIAALLETARLVTLAGTGGVGKTRLAVQVAAEVLPRFAGGAWMCELAAADDAESMAQVIASALGCVQHPGLSLSASIVEYLKPRELLLVLDNCEHLLDDAGALADAVVRGCPKITVLATSREALDVAGEHVARVRSLATPKAPGESGAEDPEPEDVASMRLFRDRAVDAGAEGGWDTRQWAAVAEICRRVDGIPLAIELAAARTVSMNPIDVARHLDERFRLLTGKRRGRIERHQTLRATVDWSYQLLDPDERVVFDRLGTFAGSFDEAAATAVARDDRLDAWTVTDALASLVEKSMLGTESGPDGATRYTMLETLRQYAREQLDAAGDSDRCRRELAHRLAVVAHDAGHGVMGPEDALWLARIHAEIDNLRATVAWALDSEEPSDPKLGLSILAPLGWISQNCGDLDLDAYATRALPFAETAEVELRVPVLALAAYDRWVEGDLDGARELLQRALDCGIVPTLVTPLDPYVLLVAVEMTAGNHARAFELMTTLRALLDRHDLQNEVGRTLAGFATFEAMAGRIDDAIADSDRGIRLGRGIGNLMLLGNALNGRAWALQRDDPEAALHAAEEFLDLYRRHGIARSVVPGTTALAGGLHARLGDDDGAVALIHEAVVISRDDGAMPQAAAALGFALRPLCRTGRPEVAAILVGALDRGAVAHVARFPGAAEGRARALAQIRGALGDEQTNLLVDRGASMPYDEVIRYALDQLAPDPR
jgi:predicted ATPase/class 3 adenylate cyclase